MSFPSFLQPSFFELEETESTNRYCKDNAHKLPNGAVVYTFSQTDGKGSKGRKWITDPKKALALSVLLKDVPCSELSALPLVMGVSAMATLKSCGFYVKLKWPNDLLLCGKKVAGLLCESELSGEKGTLVCGIGLNLLQTKEDFSKNQLPFAGSLLSQTGKTVSAEEWIPLFAQRFLKDFEILCEKGFGYFCQSYCENCVTLGKSVFVKNGDTADKFEAVSVALDGRLVLKGEEGTRLVHCADVGIHSDYADFD